MCWNASRKASMAPTIVPRSKLGTLPVREVYSARKSSRLTQTQTSMALAHHARLRQGQGGGGDSTKQEDDKDFSVKCQACVSGSLSSIGILSFGVDKMILV